MGLNTREIGPSATKKGQKRVKLLQNCANLIFSAHFGFSRSNEFFVGSVAYRFQEESEPVILSYFLWHYSRIVSTYEVECSKMLQVEPSLKISSTSGTGPPARRSMWVLLRALFFASNSYPKNVLFLRKN